MAAYRNPANGDTKTHESPWLWCLLFGGFYFAALGIWKHAVIGLAAAALTCGLAWLVYPFYARQIVRDHYLSQGWSEVAS
jgi:hypothetical protein